MAMNRFDELGGQTAWLTLHLCSTELSNMMFWEKYEDFLEDFI